MSFNIKYFTQVVDTFIKQKDKLENETINIIVTKDKYGIEKLGKYICALANYAAYKAVPFVYAVWGIDNKKNIVGTTYMPPSKAELAFNLMIKAVYDIMSLDIKGKTLVVLEVTSATSTTMQYDGVEYILDNTLKMVKLKDSPEMENQLWIKIAEKKSFLSTIAKSNVSIEGILDMLDCEKLFSMLKIPYMGNPSTIISKLLELRFINERNTGKYDITNLGALLMAKHLKRYATIAHKAVRVVVLDKNSEHVKEITGEKGYLAGFKGLLNFITKSVEANSLNIPPALVWELVTNALMHQNFDVKGSPVVSIFKDRIDITNPGKPLVEPTRFIDCPPITRNENLVYVMLKAGICESCGSGYDKVISIIENYNLPSPVITAYNDKTKVTLYVKTEFRSFTKQERIQACYDHVCLNYVRNAVSNNATLCQRFQLSKENKNIVSKIYAETCEKKLIR